MGIGNDLLTSAKCRSTGVLLVSQESIALLIASSKLRHCAYPSSLMSSLAYQNSTPSSFSCRRSSSANCRLFISLSSMAFRSFLPPQPISLRPNVATRVDVWACVMNQRGLLPIVLWATYSQVGESFFSFPALSNVNTGPSHCLRMTRSPDSRHRLTSCGIVSAVRIPTRVLFEEESKSAGGEVKIT